MPPVLSAIANYVALYFAGAGTTSFYLISATVYAADRTLLERALEDS